MMEDTQTLASERWREQAKEASANPRGPWRTQQWREKVMRPVYVRFLP